MEFCWFFGGVMRLEFSPREERGLSLVGFLEQGRGLMEELLQEAFSVAGEAADDLKRRGVFVGDLVEVAVVEGEDLRAGVAEQDRRVGGDEELGVLVAAKGVVDEDEEGELALRGEGGFGFVEEEEAVAGELVLEEGEEGFAVRASVEALSTIRLEDLA